ncbi:hypothetical protein GYMLUDRAFT_64526 [Collybiopsis luxurians FD-317 M1]|uniref:CCHC-type domain-containing protein n=1 Tax=Collybiopsis luxurians FD-317 M1 TaxID=944289 RepID=A0A0D0BC14_9AGAR|nr:hypothetical protein GYMLUDRAFT_64526 [Collybiopsis luxurians FD-317 M1]
MFLGSISGEGLRKPMASGKYHFLSHRSQINERESGLLNPGSHPMQESVPSEARGPRGGSTPEGVQWPTLRPAVLCNDQSVLDMDLPEADEHSQVAAGAGMLPESQSYGNFNSNRNFNNSLTRNRFMVEANSASGPEHTSYQASPETPNRNYVNTDPSYYKGKSIDPRNWGAANLSNDETDRDIQMQIYESLRDPDIQKQWQLFLKWQQFMKWYDNEDQNDAQVPMVKEIDTPRNSCQPSVQIKESLNRQSVNHYAHNATSELRPESVADRIVNLTNSSGRRSASIAQAHPYADRPSDFIAQDSRLGKSMFGMHMDSQPRYVTELWPGSNAVGIEEQNPLYKTNIKPIPPSVYGGAMSVREFMQFVKQASQYEEDGNVPIHREVDIVSNFLKGNAYNFYERTCGDYPERWTFQKFFIHLYDYIFPLSFRTEQCYLCDTIGTIEEQEKVSLLWDGFNDYIATGLYTRNLHPERSSFAEVAEHAEVLELIEEVKQKYMEDSGEQSDCRDAYSSSSDTDYSDNRGQSGLNDPFYHDPSEPAKSHDNFSDCNSDQNETSGGCENFSDYECDRSGTSGEHTNDDFINQGQENNFADQQYAYNQGQTWRQRRNRLSAEEHSRYLAERRCFTCGNIGHISRFCVNDNSVNSDEHLPSTLFSSNNMEFELLDSDYMDEPVIELTVDAINWFEDVEATYYSDESDDWQPEESDELTDSKDKEEDLGFDPMTELQDIDVSDSETEYGYESDSNISDESSTTYLMDTQNLTFQESSYPSCSESLRRSLTDDNDSQSLSYPTYFDSKPFALTPKVVNCEPIEMDIHTVMSPENKKGSDVAASAETQTENEYTRHSNWPKDESIDLGQYEVGRNGKVGEVPSYGRCLPSSHWSNDKSVVGILPTSAISGSLV